MSRCGIVFLFTQILAILSVGCNDEPAMPDENTGYFRFPDHFPEVVYPVLNNPIREAGFALGKKLFFDTSLSADGTISCNSCHQQSRAFADMPLHPFSIGIQGKVGKRNALPIANLAYRKEFFWDGGVTHLDFVAINALESPLEMGTTLAAVVSKLNADRQYRVMFQAAFGIDTITSPYMLQAFSQYMLTLISDQSKYDHYIRSGKDTVFSAAEKKGLSLFEKHCAACHKGILFTDQSFRNNGISETFVDTGRAAISNSESDIGKFMVPSLRNVAVTAPYMHHAKFETLAAVLQHYAEGIVASPTLDRSLKKSDGTLGIPLSSADQKNLIAFLKTLTDTSFLNNPKFRNRIR